MSEFFNKEAALFEELYFYVRGCIGSSLVVGGLSLRLAHKKERGLRAFGAMYLSIGALFTMSALDPILELPVDLDNLLYQSLMCYQGIVLIDIALYLFGNEQKAGGRSILKRAGLGYAALLVLLPLLDYALGLESNRSNVEDSLLRAPLHAAAIQAAYAWPIAATIAALRIARWKLADITGKTHEEKRLLSALGLVILDIAAILIGLALSQRFLYRLGHLLLELLLLGGYLYVVHNPRALMRLRSEIGQEHARRISLGEDEAALIEKRLASIADKAQAVFDEGFDLRKLAALIGIPPYRLSAYFSSRRRLSFPAWKNKLRIEYVRARMAQRPDLTILEISVEAGYRSKTTFNEQFARIVGMSPSDYRRSLSRDPQAH
ncbi:MAG TPA: helix-turn-helix domain-containing protein [Spirochaetales bacterium]|nr:helix-turn-helix domain-containing protein [Spirochaetales bacterium]HRY55387.1 helix-turn-helix domain-containing protein [Spirochaetia bacterium]